MEAYGQGGMAFQPAISHCWMGTSWNGFEFIKHIKPNHSSRVTQAIIIVTVLFFIGLLGKGALFLQKTVSASMGRLAKEAHRCILPTTESLGTSFCRVWTEIIALLRGGPYWVM